MRGDRSDGTAGGQSPRMHPAGGVYARAPTPEAGLGSAAVVALLPALAVLVASYPTVGAAAAAVALPAVVGLR